MSDLQITTSSSICALGLWAGGFILGFAITAMSLVRVAGKVKAEDIQPPQDPLTREEVEAIKAHPPWVKTAMSHGADIFQWPKLCDMALAYLDTLADSKTPQGWQLVPIKCTEEMVKAALSDPITSGVVTTWNAMLASAPTHSEMPQGWQPIDEVEEETVVLFYDETWGQYIGQIYDGLVCDEDGNGLDFDAQPTHFQPLPSPPTLSAKDNKNEQ